MVVDAFAGIFSVATACLSLLVYRLYLECQTIPSCETERMPQLNLISARQALSEESDTDCDEHVCSSVEVGVRAVEAIEVQERLDL